jgi:hypothetical protein
VKVQNRATDHSGVWAADGGWEHGCMPMTSTAAWKRLLNRHRPPVCNLLSRYERIKCMAATRCGWGRHESRHSQPLARTGRCRAIVGSNRGDATSVICT